MNRGDPTHSRHESLESRIKFGGSSGVFGRILAYSGVTGGPGGPGGPGQRVLHVQKFGRSARTMSHSGRIGGVRAVWRVRRVQIRAKRVVRRRMRDEKEASWDDISWENI